MMELKIIKENFEERLDGEDFKTLNDLKNLIQFVEILSIGTSYENLDQKLLINLAREIENKLSNDQLFELLIKVKQCAHAINQIKKK
jgi:hypothetical protein